MSATIVSLPQISEEDLGSSKATKQIMNYLYMLNEQLKYNQSHISSDDFDSDTMALFKKMAKKIELTAGTDNIVSLINLSSEGILIQGEKIDLAGYVTITSLKGEGQTVINGSNITTGNICSYNFFKRDTDGKLIIDVTTGNPTKTGEGTFIDLSTGFSIFSGEYIYAWLEESEKTTHKAYIKLENGRMRITDTTDDQNTLFFSHEGISTTFDANDTTSGVIDFRSHIYNAASEGSEYKGITIRTKNSPVALQSTENSIIINPRSIASEGNLFDFDTSATSKFGRIRFGNRTFEINEDGTTYTKKLDCGLLFDHVEQAIYATDGEGTKDGLVEIYAKNMPKPLTALSITTSTITETNADGTNTYNLERDTDGVITSATDGNGNKITISIS